MTVLRQLEVLEFMRRYQLEHHMPPTLREIAGEFGFASTNTVAGHLGALKKKGLVRHRTGIARGWLALPAEGAT